VNREKRITINGKGFSLEAGETVLEVAQRNGIDIPTLCYIKGSMPTGACRICLVEVKGARNLLPACATPATHNMVVETESERGIRYRRLNIELLLASGNHNCLTCEANGDCVLQELAYRYQVEMVRFPESPSDMRLRSATPLSLGIFLAASSVAGVFRPVMRFR